MTSLTSLIPTKGRFLNKSYNYGQLDFFKADSRLLSSSNNDLMKTIH